MVPAPAPAVATDGEPAMVGRCARRRRDESDDLPRAVVLDAAELLALAFLAEVVDILCKDVDDEALDEGGCMPVCRRLATRCTVLLGNDI